MWFARIVQSDQDFSYAVRKAVEFKCSPYADIAYIVVEPLNEEAVMANKIAKAPAVDLSLPKV